MLYTYTWLIFLVKPEIEFYACTQKPAISRVLPLNYKSCFSSTLKNKVLSIKKRKKRKEEKEKEKSPPSSHVESKEN